MSELSFLSPDLARAGGGFEPVARSPLARALEHAPPDVRDLSLVGKLEVRGEVGAIDGGEVVQLTPRRALVLCADGQTADLRRQLRKRFELVADMTAALAGLQVHGEPLLRRLTDLDLDALPAVGAVAHVQTVVLRAGEEFRLFFPQEYGHYVAEVVLDAIEGLRT